MKQRQGTTRLAPNGARSQMLWICGLLTICASFCGCRSIPKAEFGDVLQPSHARDWYPNHAVLPEVVADGSQLHVKNIRNTRYLSDDEYIVQHYDDDFDLNELESVDFVVVPFKEAASLAHTMLSFGFKDGRHLVISVEARMERDETYSAVAGALRQYELMYLVADERDVIPLRTKYRNVDVFIYRSTAGPKVVQALFLDMVGRVNGLKANPEFYDSLTNNCTSNIVRHINRMKPGLIPLDLRVLLPGNSDRFAFDRGLIVKHGNFAATKAAAKVQAELDPLRIGSGAAFF